MGSVPQTRRGLQYQIQMESDKNKIMEENDNGLKSEKEATPTTNEIVENNALSQNTEEQVLVQRGDNAEEKASNGGDVNPKQSKESTPPEALEEKEVATHPRIHEKQVNNLHVKICKSNTPTQPKDQTPTKNGASKHII